MTSSSMLEGSYNGELHGLAVSTRTNNVRGFFIPEIAPAIREKALLSLTVGNGGEPTNSMNCSTNLDMCSMPSSLFFLPVSDYPNRSESFVGGGK